MREFKIRASACGNIMGPIGLTETQEKTLLTLSEKEKLTDKQAETINQLLEKRENPILPDGAKTYCQDWLKGQLYDKRKVISSKYLSKGIIVEDEAIELASEYLGWGLVTKNEQFFQNDFMQGTPDLVLNDCIPDIKSSWDHHTFPLFETEVNKDYYWQLQVYMELCKKDHAPLVYVLMDTPEHLIMSAVRSQSFQLGYDDIDEDFYNSIAKNMTYKNTPIELRIKKYDIERNQEDIDSIYERVEMCRNYIKTLRDKL